MQNRVSSSLAFQVHYTLFYDGFGEFYMNESHDLKIVLSLQPNACWK